MARPTTPSAQAYLLVVFNEDGADGPIPLELQHLDRTNFSLPPEIDAIRPGSEVFFYRSRRGVIAYGVKGESPVRDWFVINELDDDDGPLIAAAQLRSLKLQAPTAANPVIRLSASDRLSLKMLWEAAEERQDAKRRLMLAEIALRPDQPEFAARVRRRWKDRCPLSGWSGEFCQAAHIIDFAVYDDREAADPDNGILLAAHLHQAFDRGLFTIRPNGEIVWSNRIEEGDRALIAGLVPRIAVTERAASYLSRRLAEFEAAESNPPRV